MAENKMKKVFKYFIFKLIITKLAFAYGQKWSRKN